MIYRALGCLRGGLPPGRMRRPGVTAHNSFKLARKFWFSSNSRARFEDFGDLVNGKVNRHRRGNNGGSKRANFSVLQWRRAWSVEVCWFHR